MPDQISASNTVIVRARKLQINVDFIIYPDLQQWHSCVDEREAFSFEIQFRVNLIEPSKLFHGGIHDNTGIHDLNEQVWIWLTF